MGMLQRKQVSSRGCSSGSGYTHKYSNVSDVNGNEAPKDTRPIDHFDRPSLLSSHSGFTNYSGLLNLVCILLVLVNAHVAMNNLTTYSAVLNPFKLLYYIFNDGWVTLGLAICCNLFIVSVFGVEWSIATRLIGERTGLLLHGVILVTELVFPATVVVSTRSFSLLSCVVVWLYAITFMKLFSYVMVHKWSRTISPGSGKVSPVRVAVADVYYFMIAPTLCYEADFRRTNSIRKYFVIRRLLEGIVLFQVILTFIQRWVLSTLMDSPILFSEMEAPYLVERVLLLSVPTLILFCIWFYFFFHSVLNLTAELTYFADREFYRDWWNATSIAQFWKDWNVCVHRWAFRHVYRPLRGAGYSRASCGLLVFLLSAFFHEYCVSVPFGMFRWWAFIGMMVQLPLIAITSLHCIQGRLGNVIVWLSLLLGQPVSIMMYFHDSLLVQYRNHLRGTD